MRLYLVSSSKKEARTDFLARSRPRWDTRRLLINPISLTYVRVSVKEFRYYPFDRVIPTIEKTRPRGLERLALVEWPATWHLRL